MLYIEEAGCIFFGEDNCTCTSMQKMYIKMKINFISKIYKSQDKSKLKSQYQRMKNEIFELLQTTNVISNLY